MLSYTRNEYSIALKDPGHSNYSDRKLMSRKMWGGGGGEGRLITYIQMCLSFHACEISIKQGMGTSKQIVLGIEGGFNMLIKKNNFH